MSLRKMRTAEMITTTLTWVDVNHADHKTLIAQPLLAALMPMVVGAHSGLFAVYQVSPASPAMLSIQGQQRVLDIEHDEFLRLLWHCFHMLRFVLKNSTQRERVERLIRLIFPIGLSVVQRSYREEAGHGEAVAANLTEEDRAFLASVPLPEGRTALDVVTDWLAAARRLGELDRARTGADTGRADHAAARAQWMKAIQAVRFNASLVVPEDPAVVELMRRLDRVERDAERRAASARSSAGDGAGEGDELPGGELPGGELPGGELPGGELPGGELPTGDIPEPEDVTPVI